MTALTPVEAAEMLRVSVPMVYKLIHVHGLPHIKLGRRVVIPRDSLERWMEARVQGEGAKQEAGA